MSAEWMVDFQSPDHKTQIEHRNGIAWHDAPVPARWHRCTPQTRGWVNYLTEVLRCACGAVSMDGGRHWLERNGRRKSGRAS